jgi:hypothetical protein
MLIQDVKERWWKNNLPQLLSTTTPHGMIPGNQPLDLVSLINGFHINIRGMDMSVPSSEVK